MRNLSRTLALMVVALMCIGGVAGTAFAVDSLGDDAVTRAPAFDALVTSNGSLAANAPAVDNVSASDVGITTATITWNTDVLANSQVVYGNTTDYGSTATDAYYVLSHSVVLTNLIPATTYHYKAVSTDLFGGTSESGDYTFTTASDNTGPVISNVAAINITATSATITWTTDEAATSLVEYGTNPSYGSEASAPGLVTDHSVDLTGLTAGTTYHYKVTSMDASGNSSHLKGFSFATLDVAGPLFYDIKATDVTGTSATIIWLTSENATSQVEYVEYGLDYSYGSKTPLDPTLVMSHSVALSGLGPKTVYRFRVQSTDVSGNPAQSGDYVFATLDVDAPVISGVAATNITGTSATITWTTDDPAQSQVEYGESLGYGLPTIFYELYVTDHSVNLTGLNSQTTYHYKVKSRDASGIWAESGDFTFTTPDITAPAISGVVVTDISATAANIIWITNESATGLVEYGTTANYGSTTSHNETLTSDHKAHLTGLESQTTYHYRVKSRDSAGLWAESEDRTFTTTDINAPVISNVAATGITGTDAAINWTTDDAAESQVEYGTSASYGLITALDTNRVTKHTVYLTALSPQVTYHYKVKSRDASGLWAESVDYTFTTGTDPGGIPPTIMIVKAFNMTGSGATIAWETNREATSQVEYGLTTKYDKKTIFDVSLERYHSVDLKGLKANRTYHYRVISRDAFGNQVQSEDQTFDTTIGKAPSLNLPIWAWAVIGTTVALVVGVMVIREF